MLVLGDCYTPRAKPQTIPSKSASARKEIRLSKRKLLAVVDDDEEFREALATLLRTIGFQVDEYRSGPDFLASSKATAAACLIADVQMPGMTGIQLYRRMVETGNMTPTILVTAYPDEAVKKQMLIDGVVCYLQKPIDQSALMACINSVVE
jgi:FixJ family two-component response regulator